MTRSLAIDANNDLYLDDADGIAVVTGLAAALQNCKTAARTLQGEMVFAADEGIPYFQAVWVGQPNLAVFEAAMRQRLLAVADVTGIVEFTTRLEGNDLRYDATISTVYGEGAING